MKKEFIGLSLVDLSPVYHTIPSKRRREWKYQFPGDEVQTIEKEGKWWYYNSEDGCSVGCDTLNGAKGDLIYSGAKVWLELVNN